MTTPVAERANVTSRPGFVLLVLLGAYVCHAMDRSVLNMLFEPIRHEFALSDAELGLLSGLAYAVPFALAGLPLGLLADRVNRVRLLAGVVLIWSALTAFSGLARGYVSLLLARVGVGAAEAGCPPTALSLIADCFPGRQRATAVGIFYLGVPLGMLAGFAVAGVVAANYGWRAAFFVAGVPGLLVALLMWFGVHEPLRGQHDAVEQRGVADIRQTWRFVRGQRAVFHLMFMLPLAAMTGLAMGTWIPSYLVRSHDFNLREVGLVLALALGVGGAIGSVSGGWIADRLARRHAAWAAWVPVIAIAGASIAGCVALLATSRSAAVVGIVCWGLCNSVWYGPAYGLALTLVGPRMRGATIGLLVVLANLVGAGLGPQVVGVLSDGLAPRYGVDALRYALLMVLSLNVWAMAHGLLAARSVVGDRQRLAGLADGCSGVGMP